MNSFKRSAPEFTDTRPSKRQATSSPEEGELDDTTPPPAPRSPTPVKSSAKPGAKVPFPFKKKGNVQEAPQEPSASRVNAPPGVYVRSAEDERRFREEQDWRTSQSRPSRHDSQHPSDAWSRHDSWRPRGDRYYQDSLNDQDRRYPPRTEQDRWDSRDSPRYSYNKRYASRSPSSPRSRSPASPASSSKEKHRLPPPRSPISDSYSKDYYDDREDGRKRSRDGKRRSRPSWEADTYLGGDRYAAADTYIARDTYVAADSYVPSDDYSRDRWSRERERERRYDEDDDRGYRRSVDRDAYQPISPRHARSPQRPLSPQSIGSLPKAKRSTGPRTPPLPPQPDAPPPPTPPGGDVRSILPDRHQAVRIPLPKKPPTPVHFSPPNRPLPGEERPSAPKPKPEPHRTKESLHTRVLVQRPRRKPVQRTREEEQKLYGRIFEGCGCQEDYDVITKLGEGTFGEVHKAIHVKKHHAVALKRILMHNEKEGMPVTALREIKILKALHHPCIVDILDMFVVRSKGKESPLSVYMVFPYMDHDLAGLLENERVKLSPSQIKLYMKQLLEGTEYMHRNHILHRDMKAANLLISNTGSLKIADFGLARAFDPNIIKGGVGRDGKERKYTNCVVTRWYRPPELLLGARQYGGEVDMWGIGCVFGEMFWRRPILPGTSDLDQLDKIWQLCGTPTEYTWPGYEALPGCEGVKRFNMYPRRLKQTYETIGSETCDLLDKLLTCNPRERLTASQALDHDYFWTDPLPADPKMWASFLLFVDFCDTTVAHNSLSWHLIFSGDFSVRLYVLSLTLILALAL
ncbi:unnamed protein product [Somion occarium]|uniref:Protein kinase domain-containing protein n=1 Tax=Somion occarium TaxID=3059160 RepID=A0ABP1DNF5_9APHY